MRFIGFESFGRYKNFYRNILHLGIIHKLESHRQILKHLNSMQLSYFWPLSARTNTIRGRSRGENSPIVTPQFSRFQRSDSSRKWLRQRAFRFDFPAAKTAAFTVALLHFAFKQLNNRGRLVVINS